MKNIRLQDAFSPVPPKVHAHVEDALKEVRDTSAKKARPLVAVILAAALALGLMGAALASAISGGVLDFLFKRSDPPEALRDLVRPVGVSRESDGLTTTVVDTLFDGHNISLGLMFEGETRAFAVLDSITVNGVSLWLETSNLENMWVNGPDSEGESPTAYGLSGALDAEYLDLEAPEARAAYDTAMRRMRQDGKADVSLHLTLLVPKAQLQPIEGLYTEDSRAAWQAIDACVAAGNTPIDSDEPYSVLVSSAWLGDEDYEHASAGQHPLGDAQALVDYANMRVLDSFSLSFTLSADTSRNLDCTPDDSLNDGRTHIVFNEISFTPLRSTFDFTITPDGMTMEEIERTFRWFAFYGSGEDSAPTPLAFQDVFAMGDSWPEEQPDGSLALRVHYRMPALESLPGAIHIVPYNEESSAEEPLWSYVILLGTN